MPTVRGTRGNFARSKKLAKYTQTLHLGVVTMINIGLFVDKKWVATTSYTDWDWVMMLLNLPNIFCRRIERSETGSDMQIHTLCVLSSAKWNVLFMFNVIDTHPSVNSSSFFLSLINNQNHLNSELNMKDTKQRFLLEMFLISLLKWWSANCLCVAREVGSGSDKFNDDPRFTTTLAWFSCVN